MFSHDANSWQTAEPSHSFSSAQPVLSVNPSPEYPRKKDNEFKKSEFLISLVLKLTTILISEIGIFKSKQRELISQYAAFSTQKDSQAKSKTLLKNVFSDF